MKRVYAALLVLPLLLPGVAPARAADGEILERVRERGVLVCGLRGGISGYSFADPQGHLDGFMVDFCRALAAATLGDARAVRVARLPDKPREYGAVLRGSSDIAFTTTTWTFSREATENIEFLTPLIHDGQGFAIWRDEPGPGPGPVPESRPVPPLNQLADQTVCVKESTTTLRNLEDHIAANGLSWKPRTFVTLDEAVQAFISRECGMLTTDRTVLVASLANYRTVGLGVHIYPEVISREPLTPYVARGDRQWHDIARWTIFATIQAERLGLTAAGLKDGALPTPGTPEGDSAMRMLDGLESGAEALGLSPGWVRRVIEQVGSYGEIFERNLGDGSPYRLERGFNRPWSEGGLLYAPPFE